MNDTLTLQQLIYTINAQRRCLDQIHHRVQRVRGANNSLQPLPTYPTLREIEELSRKLAPEQYRCVHCLAIVPVGDGDECAACLKDGPPCVECGERGHAFEDTDEYGFWDEDCNYHDRYANDPRI